MLCVIHEQGNIGLNQRCEGAKTGFGGDGREPPGRRHRRRLDDADRDPVEARVRQLGRRACWRSTRTSRSPRATRSQGANSEAKVATFDLSGDVVEGDQGRLDPVRGRPAAVPAGLPAGRVPHAQQDERQHRRRRPAGADRARLRREEQRRHGRAARGGRHALMRRASRAGSRPHRAAGPTRSTSGSRRSAPARSCCSGPSSGALLGALVVLLFFAVTADRFGDAQRRGALDGRRVDARDHGRGGRAADDRRRVRPLRRRDDRHRGPADGHPRDRAGA